MNRFLFKIIFFSIVLVIVYLIYYFIGSIGNKIDQSYDFYIWGDSQTSQGLDLNVLNKSTNLKYYSMAVHGASLYDFSCFVNLVPERSKVIIGISSTIFLRTDTLEYNRTNLDFNALKLAMLSGFSFNYLKDIVLKNLKPKGNFPFNSRKKYIGSFIDVNQGELIKENFSLGINSIEIRKKYFQFIIEELRRKKCAIVLINIPQSNILKNIESHYEYSAFIKEALNGVIDGYDLQYNITMSFSEDDFYDITHLNQNGSIILSERIGDFINSNVNLKNSQVVLLNISD